MSRRRSPSGDDGGCGCLLILFLLFVLLMGNHSIIIK